MKILYINGSRIPTERAHGLQIMKMCSAFTAGGGEVELWVPQRFSYVREDPFDYYNIQRNFVIKKIPCLDFIPFSRFLGPVALWITEASFSLFVFLNLGKDFIRRRRMKSFPFVIYTRDKFVALLLSFVKKDIFFEAHDVPASIFFYRLKKVQGIIAITKNLKEEFIKRGVAARHIIVAPDGVDVNEFDISKTQAECRTKLHLPQDKKIVLYAGHLYKWKGADTLIKAASFLSLDAILYIVGGTKKDLSNVKCQMSNVKFVGHRPHKEIPYWLMAADVLVLPNSAKYGISKYWTSPMKLFEYMASGRPIVASDLPSLREVLNRNNATLVEPDNPTALAKGIYDTLNDKFEAERVASQAREDVGAYTWEKRAESIWQLLQRK